MKHCECVSFVYTVHIFWIHQVQVRTSLEKVKVQEETIKQLHEELSSQGNSSLLHHELKDLEKLYTEGR